MLIGSDADYGRALSGDVREAPLEAEELQSLGSRVPLMGDEFEAFEPTGTRSDLSHSLASSDSTTPLSPDHLLAHISPIPTPTHDLFQSFHKRYRSSYETPSPSLTLPVRKRYRGTSELILDTDSEESQGLDDEGHGLGDEDHGLDDEGHEEEEVVPEGQQQAVPVVETAASEPLGLGYRALRPHELVMGEDQPTLGTWVDLEDGRVYTNIPAYVPLSAPVQTPPSLEWSLGSLPVSPLSPVVPSPIASPMATLTATILRLDALPPTLFANIDKDVRELYTRSGAVRDEIFSQRFRFRSLEREQERAIVPFGALWRPVLALEAWAGHVDTRMADMSRAGYDDHRLIHDMLVQQVAMQRELQEMRGRVTALEQKRDRRGQ
ncbi:hypothetical protein Tco_1403766 [Tanacetum coccineum]